MKKIQIPLDPFLFLKLFMLYLCFVGCKHELPIPKIVTGAIPDSCNLIQTYYMSSNEIVKGNCALPTCHVSNGYKYFSKGARKYLVRSVSGGTPSFTMNGAANIIVWDESGHGANNSIYDVKQSNGVIHVIDAVLLPKM